MGKKKRGKARSPAPRRRLVDPAPLVPSGRFALPDEAEVTPWPGRAIRYKDRPGNYLQGERVGTVEADHRLPDGTTIKAGSPVSRVSDEEARALGLAGLTRDSLAPDEQRALALSGVSQAGAVLRPARARQPSLELPGLVRSAPGGLTGGQVLDIRTGLYESLKSPHPGISDFYRDFVSRGAREMSEAPDSMLAAAWGYMFAGIRSGEELLALVARHTGAAVPFQVTAEMVAEVTATYRKHYAAVHSIVPGDLPKLDGNEVAGFAWFDEPVLLEDANGAAVMCRAVTWCRQAVELGRETWDGVRITSWAGVDDRDSYWDAGAAETMRQFSPLILSHSVFVPFGQRFARPAADPTPDDITRWVTILWAYLRDQRAVAARVHAERHAAKRAARAGVSSDVHVITLRKTYTEREEPAGHRPVDWSCRWTVDPFTRHKPGYRQLGFAPHAAEPQGPDKTCAVCGHGTSAVRSCTKPRDRTDLPWRDNSKRVYRLAR